MAAEPLQSAAIPTPRVHVDGAGEPEVVREPVGARAAAGLDALGALLARV